MKKISLIFKDASAADAWLAALSTRSRVMLLAWSEAATIKVSTRKVKKGKPL